MGCAPLISTFGEVLSQGELLLTTLDDATYTKALPIAFHATVGGHYRHCLDHVEKLLEGLEAGEIDYDARRRDPLTETSREAALGKTLELGHRIGQLGEADPSTPLVMRCRSSYSVEEVPAVPTTLEREIIFCISHAIHHYALIAVMCRDMGVVLPEGFGTAPSTLRHRRDTAQASS
jgi:hypothetical protein